MSSASHGDRLRLRQLKLLRALGEQNTLRRAAALISVTQPTATKMLAECELIVGQPLYERHPRGLVATAAGRDMLAFSTRVLSDWSRVARSIDDRRTGREGELLVGAILGATPDVLARAVLDMKERHPRLTIRLRGESSDQVLAMLDARRLDLAVGRFSEPTQHNRYRFEPLGDETLLIVARPHHPLRERRPLRLPDLADGRWVMQSMDTPARQILEAEFGRADVPTPDDIVEANSILTVIQLLQRSNAVAMLSEPLVRDHLAAQLLCRLPVEIDARLSGFGLLTRRGEALSGPAAEFADGVRALARGSGRAPA